MNANLESLREEHEKLIVKAEEDPPPKDLLTQVDAFMQKVQKAGSSIGDSLERDLLRSFLRYWGSYVYEDKGVYPNVKLEPFTKLMPPPKLASPVLLLVAGALVLLAVAVSLFALGYLPVRQGPTPTAAVQLPTISKPEVGVSGPLKPRQEVGISVDISSVTGVALNYTWKTDGGEIVKGQGSPAIIYRVPDEPGTYNVRVVVEWDDQSVERVTSIKVEEEPTPTPTPSQPPTDTPVPQTSMPTNTPELATATPSVMLTSTTCPQWTFESGTTEEWVAARGLDWTDNYALEATVTSERASEGRYSLKCDFDGTSVSTGQFYKAIVYIERQLDMALCSRLVFDVYNSIDDMRIAISLSTGPNWVWHESPPTQLGTGWNKDIPFNLDATDFKTEASDWRHSMPVADKNDTKRLAIIFIPPKRPLAGSLYLDAIRSTPSPEAIPTVAPIPECQSFRPGLKGAADFAGDVELKTPDNCTTGLPTGTIIPVAGTYKGIPDDVDIWVLIYAPNLVYYAQSPNFCEGAKMSWGDGRWQVPIYLGAKDGYPEWFDIVVVLTDQETSQFLSEWLREGCQGGQYSGIPAAQLEQMNITEKSYITVQTRD